jgi:hypothetical protein
MPSCFPVKNLVSSSGMHRQIAQKKRLRCTKLARGLLLIGHESSETSIHRRPGALPGADGMAAAPLADFDLAGPFRRLKTGWVGWVARFG